MENSIVHDYVNSDIYVKAGITVDATNIRKYMNNNFFENCKDLVPEEVINIILNKNI
jgi:predicted nucleotidyltransferase